MRQTADNKLVAAAKAGDTAAYGGLFERYQNKIYSYAYGLLGDSESAADVAQDAFVRVFEMLPHKDAEDLYFKPYLYRTTHNLAMNAIKERGKFAPPETLDLAFETSLSSDPEKVALLREQQEQTWRAAFQLSDKHRSILALRELGDMSYADIAEAMEMPRNTVGVLLSRARLQFKEAFRMSSVDAKDIAKECEDMLPLLSGYIDKELTAEDTKRVEVHLKECAFCPLALEEMTEASKSYRALLPLLPPAGFAAGLMGRIEEAAAAEDFGNEATSSETAEDGSEAAEQTLADTAKAKNKGGGIKKGAVVALIVSFVAMGALVLYGMGMFSGDGDDVAETDIGLPAAEPTSTVPSNSFDTSVVAPGTIAQPRDAADASGGTSGSIVPTDTTPPDMPQQVTPTNEYVFDGAEMEFVWTEVTDPSGVTYTLQIETYSLDQDSYVAYRTFTNLPETTFRHEMPTYLERWRIWAVDGAGNASNATDWRVFSRKLIVTPSAEGQTQEPPAEDAEAPTLY